MTERLYKSKADKDKCLILDDRHQLHAIYSSKCTNCKHFEDWDYFCSAFPDGIPDEYLSGEKDCQDVLGVSVVELFDEPKNDVFQCPECGTTLVVKEN